jgi:hypothetical protein
MRMSSAADPGSVLVGLAGNAASPLAGGDRAVTR